MAKRNRITSEHLEFLKENKDLDRKTLTNMLNEKFECTFAYGSVKSIMIKYGFKSKNTGRFTKGCGSWNKGLKGEEYFEKVDKEKVMAKVERMHEANKTAKVGDEYIYNGIPYIRIDAGKRFKKFGGKVRKRDYVWELNNGKKPKGNCIIHLDGNHLNCNISNLRCIPRKYMTLLMKNGWFSENDIVTETAIKWCEMYFVLKGE